MSPFRPSRRWMKSESTVPHSLFCLDLGHRIWGFRPWIFLLTVDCGWTVYFGRAVPGWASLGVLIPCELWWVSRHWASIDRFEVVVNARSLGKLFQAFLPALMDLETLLWQYLFPATNVALQLISSQYCSSIGSRADHLCHRHFHSKLYYHVIRQWVILCPRRLRGYSFSWRFRSNIW